MFENSVSNDVQLAQQGSAGGFAFVSTFGFTTPWWYPLEIFELAPQPLGKGSFALSLGIDG